MPLDKKNVLFKLNERIGKEILAGIILCCCLGYTFIFSYEPKPSMTNLIMFCGIIISLLIIYIFYCMNKMKIYKGFFLFIILTGGILVFIQPILMTPDEGTHFIRAEITSRGELIIDPTDKNYETIQSELEINHETGKTYNNSFLKGKKIDNSIINTDHIAAGNLFFLYIPQTIGIILAKLLNLNAIWMLWLARLLNLVCYGCIVAFSIKIAPKLKWVIGGVAVLPLSIQQAASCSPDAIINGSVLLLISYFIFLYEKEELTWKEYVVFLLLGIITTLSKVTNIFFCGLVLILPAMSNYSKKKTVACKLIFLILFITVGISYFLYSSSFQTPESVKLFLEESSLNVNSSQQISFILNNFSSWVIMFGKTIINDFTYHITELNCFGRLEYSYSILDIFTLLTFGKLCFQEDGVRLSYINKFLVFLMIIGNYFFISLAMYLTWTSVGANSITGVQGRYLIPMIAMGAVLLTAPKYKSEKEIESEHNNSFVLLLMMVGMMLVVLTKKYY